MLQRHVGRKGSTARQWRESFVQPLHQLILGMYLLFSRPLPSDLPAHSRLCWQIPFKDCCHPITACPSFSTLPTRLSSLIMSSEANWHLAAQGGDVHLLFAQELSSPILKSKLHGSDVELLQPGWPGRPPALRGAPRRQRLGLKPT